MTTPPFRSTRVDSRRLTTPAHLLTRQSPAERRRIHGALLPMEEPADPRDWTRGEWLLLLAGIAAVLALYALAAGALPW